MHATNMISKITLATVQQRAVVAPAAHLLKPRSRTVRVVAAATLYERLGGKDAVNAAVDVFYQKVLADDRVKSYFQGTNMNKQRAHQAAFMTVAFGGPNNYKGKDMAAAHKNLMPHLEEVHFQAIVENFVATLQELGVAQEDIDDAVAVVATTKEAVLTH